MTETKVVTNFLFWTKFEFDKGIDHMTIHEWSLNVTFQWVDLARNIITL